MEWNLFLTDGITQRAESKIHEIAYELTDTGIRDGGLMGGAAGLACFYAYYADWTGELRFDQLAVGMIEQALNPAAGFLHDLRFSDGLAGTAWMLRSLIDAGLLELDADSIYTQLHPHLYQAMMSEMLAGNYDYLHGALGLALYFLDHTKDEKVREYLADLIDKLHKKAENEADGSMKWASILDSEKGFTGYNISLSHGISSIVIILSQLYEKGIEADKCRAMIMGAMRYLEKQRLPAEEFISIFPSWAMESSKEVHSSRLAWCYGDLGIGLAYLAAGKVFPGESFNQEGLHILLRSSERRDLEENSVKDAGLCHGAAGIALINNVLFHRTGYTAFRDSAMHWLDVCLNMAIHDDGIAGYKSWTTLKYGGWRRSPGFLEGAAGIGLCMLSFISGRIPLWSRSLLISHE